MTTTLDTYRQQLEEIESAGRYKHERIITTPQRASIDTTQRTGVLNFCANNYLGLASHPGVIAAAHEALDRWGFGLSSVRFICGTQQLHKDLENALTEFLGTEDTILYSSCFDANGGLFETLLGPDDAVISDELNHASIIDGVRLCKAKRYRYRNSDMQNLEDQLKQAGSDGVKNKLITTDGVFSMDGYVAKLDEICMLAEKHGAMVHFDDCHATGFVGQNGRGTHEHRGVVGRITLTTGTLGKALGGASGGYTSGKRELIDLLRQRSRPYLFSNTLAPAIAAGSLKALELVRGETGNQLRNKLHDNTAYFRKAMTEAGFDVLAGEHPITPVMVYDDHKAAAMAEGLLEHGVYAIAFSYPVVPQGKARIRIQVSAAHERADLDKAVEAFKHCRA
ncbi:MAG: glycine C-acetyltransferase [Phycisphaera sp.]|nr:glycine C-acetyltransferase [Phycisphaera sp.]